MNKFTQAIKNFWQDEEGLTVVEYVIGAGLLVVALAGLFATMGTQLEAKITAIIGNIADGS
ncbi:Flp family type IVb pilin [Vibrio sp. CDRSL-10 TSBA]